MDMTTEIVAYEDDDAMSDIGGIKRIGGNSEYGGSD
jgi:hypothetical protein